MPENPVVLEATRENFAQLVLENSQMGPVLVDFWAAWAGPCVRQREMLLLLAKLLIQDDYVAALEQLSELHRRDPEYRRALPRRALLVLFDLLGPDDERSRRFRKMLFGH